MTTKVTLSSATLLVSESPMFGKKCDKKKWSRESAEFAAGGATNIDGSIHRACSLVEDLVLVGGNCPSECASRWKQ
jgi:hypothetical protein